MRSPNGPRSSPLVLAAIVDGPLTRDRESAALARHGWTPARDAPGQGPFGLVGASIRFEGIVRRGEPPGGVGEPERDLAALNYRTYDPMAERELLALSRSVADGHVLTALAALHSRGRVAVGEVSFVLVVESSHRAEALAAMTEFIDRLKQDVPIWKLPVWA